LIWDFGDHMCNVSKFFIAIRPLVGQVCNLRNGNLFCGNDFMNIQIACATNATHLESASQATKWPRIKAARLQPRCSKWRMIIDENLAQILDSIQSGPPSKRHELHQRGTFHTIYWSLGCTDGHVPGCGMGGTKPGRSKGLDHLGRLSGI